MRFALVVPALNEEEAITNTLRRCLDARQKVQDATHIDEMQVVFVNDGSTDGTQAIVDQPEFDEVVKVRFEKNQGYGAAIKAGWEATDAELIGFIDGDGTCNPEFCIDLLNAMDQEEADVVLAARLSPETEMPMIRQIGNKLFAGLLGIVSGKELTDSASGFRIVKRSALKLMSPLPDGLHFTPAMSCICLLDPRLKIVEVHGMKYKEREGRSKLSVVRDGLRFLFTIIFSACCYSPLKTMLSFSAIGIAILALFTLVLNIFIPNLWFPASSIASALVVMAIATGIVTHQLNFLLIGPRRKLGIMERTLQWLIEFKRMIFIGITLTVGGIAVLPFWREYVDSGFGLWVVLTLTFGGAAMALTGVMLRVIWAVGEKQKALIDNEYILHDAHWRKKTVVQPKPKNGATATPAA